MSADGQIQYDYIADKSPDIVKHFLIPALEKCKDIAGMYICMYMYIYGNTISYPIIPT